MARRPQAVPAGTDRMTTTEVARYLEVGEAWIRKMAQDGKFTDMDITPLGRLFSRAEVEAMKQDRLAQG